MPQGDFALDGAGRIHHRAHAPASTPTYTYSTIGLYRPSMVQGVTVGDKAALKPFLDRAIDQDRLGGRVWHGDWTDVGTPERLRALG